MQAGNGGNIKSDINVTPLVDVVLVLLIIFMVVTPMLQKGPAVKLPETENPAKKPENTDEVLVVLDDKGSYWIETDKIPVNEDDFPARMVDMRRLKPEGDIVIKADSRLTFGKVKRAMFAVKDAGYTGVALIADRKGGPAGG